MDPAAYPGLKSQVSLNGILHKGSGLNLKPYSRHHSSHRKAYLQINIEEEDRDCSWFY